MSTNAPGHGLTKRDQCEIIRSTDRMCSKTSARVKRAAMMGVKRQERSTKESAASKPDSETRLALLAATEACLHTHGYAGLSTRRVAEAANMPLSQIHYHFG